MNFIQNYHNFVIFVPHRFEIELQKKIALILHVIAVIKFNANCCWVKDGWCFVGIYVRSTLFLFLSHHQQDGSVKARSTGALFVCSVTHYGI